MTPPDAVLKRDIASAKGGDTSDTTMNKDQFIAYMTNQYDIMKQKLETVQDSFKNMMVDKGPTKKCSKKLLLDFLKGSGDCLTEDEIKQLEGELKLNLEGDPNTSDTVLYYDFIARMVEDP